MENNFTARFVSYPSIPNDHQKGLDKTKSFWVKSLQRVNKDIDETEIDQKWVCSEKIHGCNLSFLVSEDKSIKSCRRGGTLEENESFYNFQRIKKDLEQKLFNLFEIVAKHFENNVAGIQVYGEIFGGLYVNEKGAIYKSDNSSSVQKGIFYTPNNEFLAFDIQVTLKNGPQDEDEEPLYVEYEDQLKFFEESGIKFVKPFKYGTYQELMKLEVDNLESEIYKIYGLDKVPKKNIVEGVVIRPLKGHFLIKRKSTEFKEVVENKQQKKEKKPTEKLEDNENMESIIAYINANRIQTVASKCTQDELEPKKIFQFSKLVVQDAIKDFLQDIPSDNESAIFYQKNAKKINDILSREVIKIIKADKLFD